MIKLYHEHPEFNEYTQFDTHTGRLMPTTALEFQRALSSQFSGGAGTYLQRTENDNTTLFLGETPSTHRRFPRRLYFQITRNCNLQCPTCFIKARADGAHVPTPYIKEIAVLYAGGERRAIGLKNIFQIIKLSFIRAKSFREFSRFILRVMYNTTLFAWRRLSRQ